MELNFLQEVCAVDDQTAAQFLTHCDNNLEQAVQLFFQVTFVVTPFEKCIRIYNSKKIFTHKKILSGKLRLFADGWNFG